MRIPDWLKPMVGIDTDMEMIDTLASEHPQLSISAEYCNSKEPPPLEEVDCTVSLFPSQCGWSVFHPVFGVIPKETNDLWIRQEEERTALKQKSLTKPKKKLPPVRYS